MIGKTDPVLPVQSRRPQLQRVLRSRWPHTLTGTLQIKLHTLHATTRCPANCPCMEKKHAKVPTGWGSRASAAAAWSTSKPPSTQLGVREFHSAATCCTDATVVLKKLLKSAYCDEDILALLSTPARSGKPASDRRLCTE